MPTLIRELLKSFKSGPRIPQANSEVSKGNPKLRHSSNHVGPVVCSGRLLRTNDAQLERQPTRGTASTSPVHYITPPNQTPSTPLRWVCEPNNADTSLPSTVLVVNSTETWLHFGKPPPFGRASRAPGPAPRAAPRSPPSATRELERAGNNNRTANQQEPQGFQ